MRWGFGVWEALFADDRLFGLDAHPGAIFEGEEQRVRPLLGRVWGGFGWMGG